MNLGFFCDHCVPSEIGAALESAGHRVFLLRKVMPPRSPDLVVIEKAQELDAILVTLDADFSEIVAYPPSKYGGIMALQLHNHPEIIPALMERLNAFIAARPGRDYYRGKLFIVETHRIRIRA